VNPIRFVQSRSSGFAQSARPLDLRESNFWWFAFGTRKRRAPAQLVELLHVGIDFGNPCEPRAPFRGGSLRELCDTGTPRFRCHGRARLFDAHVRRAQQSTRVGAALWAAIRSLEEQERLASRMANEAGRRGNKRSETFHREKATESAAHAEALRDLLTHAEPVPEGSKAPEAQQSHETRDR
jgi:hypothetical protein